MKNKYEDGLRKVWLTDVPRDLAEQQGENVIAEVEHAGLKGTQLHERAVIEEAASGAEGEVGIYRVSPWGDGFSYD